MTSQSIAAPFDASSLHEIRLILGLFLWFASPAAACLVAWVGDLPAVLWTPVIGWFVVIPLLDRRRTFGQGEPDNLFSLNFSKSAALAATAGTLLSLASCAAWIRLGSTDFATLAALGGSLGLVFGSLLAARCMVARADTLVLRRFNDFVRVIVCDWGNARHRTIQHQLRCATPADPVSARMGENFYAYLIRLVTSNFDEGKRGTTSGGTLRGVFDSKTLLTVGSLSVMLYSATMLYAGPLFVVLVAVALTIGWLYCAVLGYIQHYGLLRGKRIDGGYARCTQACAWHVDGSMAALITFGATRHSRSHCAGGTDDVSVDAGLSIPTLPWTLPVSLMAAVIPPLWARTVDPLVAAWADGDLLAVNIDGGAYSDLMARYHRPRA